MSPGTICAKKDEEGIVEKVTAGILSVESCINFDYTLIMTMHDRFGQFLVKRRFITPDAIISARMLQRKNNQMLGTLAKEKGWLTDYDILKILIIQEETCEKFGEIAVKNRYLTEEQLNELLSEQTDSYIFFGEALVRIGAISEEKIIEQLKEYNKLTIEPSAA